MKNTKALTLLTMSTLAIAALTGCVAGEAPEPAESNPNAEQSAPTTGQPTEDETLVDAEETEEPAQKLGPEVSLAADSGTTYVRAVQDFNPTFERWVVDGTELHFQSLNCVGSVTHEVYAQLTPKPVSSDDDLDAEFDPSLTGVEYEAGGSEASAPETSQSANSSGKAVWTATWEGEGPLFGSNDTEDDLEISDRTLAPRYAGTDEMATTHTDIELRQFTGMCKDAGEMVANFIF